MAAVPTRAELELCCALAVDAGDAILRVRDEARNTAALKSDESPVTLADLAADRVIRSGLAQVDGLVVTEEDWRGGTIGARPRVWCIDPLDGTQDFVSGRDDYVVQIGLAVDGVPALGVLYAPATSTLWRAIVGDCCERVDADGTVHALSVRERAMRGPPRIALSVAHPSPAVDAVVAGLGGVVVPRGSVGLKIGMIVDDVADAYLTSSRHIKVWDTCAPAAVLMAAGGIARSLDQTALRYDLEPAHHAGMCAWTPAAAQAMQQSLAALVKLHRPR